MPKTTARAQRAQRRDLRKVRHELTEVRLAASKTRKMASRSLKKARRARARLEADTVARLAMAERQLKIAEDEKEIFRKSMINFNRICRELTKKNKKMTAYIARKTSKWTDVPV